MEIDFTCLTNKQMNMMIKGYNRLKKKVKVQKQHYHVISSSDEKIIPQYHENNINNIDYSNIHHWLMKE